MVTQIEDERLASLKAMEAFSGVEIQLREFVDDWILLTFDLPANQKGNKARYEFLKKAQQIGAMEHTESVYLMPWTVESESIAIDIASVGDAYLWYSKAKDNTMAVAMTEKYDRDIAKLIDELGDRLVRIGKHWQDGKESLARRMMKKTWDRVTDLQGAIVRRGSIRLYERMKPLVLKLRELEELKPAGKSKLAMNYNPATKHFEKM